jgi:hypothetical protein
MRPEIRNLLFFGNPQYGPAINRLFGTAVIANWPMNEISGVTANDISGHAYHATYKNTEGVPTGVVLGSIPGPANGMMAPVFTAGNLNVYAAASGGINPPAGTVLIWLKMSAGVWTDGTDREVIYLRGGDTNNYIYIARTTANNTLRLLYKAGGVSKSVDYTNTDYGWFMAALTWDISAGADGEVKAFHNGVQVGTTQTALGTWNGPGFGTTTCVIAATSTSSATPLTGATAFGVLLNRAATPNELLQAYRLARRPT